jgi:ribonuclease-3
MTNINALQSILDYTFNDTVSIKRALTHASAHHDSIGIDYERLEFLGDRVVNLIVADLLFNNFKDEKEGALAKRHTALVRTETLADIAKELKLGDFIIFSDSERMAGGAQNDNILADIMESVTASIYLDGGYNSAMDFVKNALGNRLHDMVEPPRDPKTTLQEWSQAHNLGLPIYEVIEQSGPDHAPEFTVQVSLNGHPSHSASSTSKKGAEKEAAQIMMDYFSAKQ